MSCNAAVWKSHERGTVLPSFGLLAEEDAEDWKVVVGFTPGDGEELR